MNASLTVWLVPRVEIGPVATTNTPARPLSFEWDAGGLDESDSGSDSVFVLSLHPRTFKIGRQIPAGNCPANRW